jgi:hypothetical protein
MWAYISACVGYKTLVLLKYLSLLKVGMIDLAAVIKEF